MTIIKHRDICGLVGTLCGACIVTLVALGFGAAPARAQQNFNPLPPQVAFINNGKYTGTLLIEGKTLPITGTLAFLAGVTEYLHISVDTEGQLITSDTWEILSPTPVINEWEIVSTDPTTCRKEVLSGASFPQCTAWSRNARGVYYQKCTVTAQGNKATSDTAVVLSSDNKLVSLREDTTITGENGDSPSNLTPVINPLGPPEASFS
jgi:hypothetical protein